MVSLRPLGVVEIIGAAFKLLRRNAKTMILISAVMLVPLNVIDFIVNNYFSRVDMALAALPPDAEPGKVVGLLIPDVLFVIAVTVIDLVAQLLVQLGSLKAIVDAYLDRTPDWRSSLMFAVKRLPVALGAVLLAIVPLSGGVLLCVLPGIFLATCWSLTGTVIAVEQKGPIAALGRSFSLVIKRFWPVLGAFVLSVVMVLVVQHLNGVVLDLPVVTPGQVLVTVQGVAITVFSILLLPFPAAVLTVLYFDLRVRQEGFGLEQMAAAFDGVGVAGSAQASPDPGPIALTAPASQPPEPVRSLVDEDDPFGLGKPGGS